MLSKNALSKTKINSNLTPLLGMDWYNFQLPRKFNVQKSRGNWKLPRDESLKIITIELQNYSTASIGEFKDRGSKFIAYAFPAYSEEEWRGHLEEVKKEHFKARHHCYAFRLGLDKNNFRANDDGEPSGTAGRPILGQIDSYGLTNVIIIVVRYFGGTKLGTSGLINAYKLSAQDALEQAEIIEKTLDEIYKITFDYALMSEVMGTVKKLEIEMVRQDFGNIGVLEIAIPKNEVAEKMRYLRAGIAKVRIEEIDDIETIEGVAIDFLNMR